MTPRDRLSEVSYRDKEFLIWEKTLVKKVDTFTVYNPKYDEYVEVSIAEPGSGHKGNRSPYQLPMFEVEKMPGTRTSLIESASEEPEPDFINQGVMRVTTLDYKEYDRGGRVFL